MLLDTSGLLCYIDARDARHGDAVRPFTAARRRVTHSYVLAELIALCHARRAPRAACLLFVADLADNPLVDVHWVDEARHRAAMALLQSHADKTYSLCDAVSF